MGRKVFDFTLRGSGPEYEALVAFLTTYKNGDVRKYNEFIRNALMAYFAHISYCETMVREGGDPLPHLPFGHAKPTSSSNPAEDKTDTAKRNEASYEYAIEKEATMTPMAPHVETNLLLKNSNDSDRDANETIVSDDDIVVTMDASLGSILALDDDIP